MIVDDPGIVVCPLPSGGELGVVTQRQTRATSPVIERWRSRVPHVYPTKEPLTGVSAGQRALRELPRLDSNQSILGAGAGSTHLQVHASGVDAAQAVLLDPCNLEGL